MGFSLGWPKPGFEHDPPYGPEMAGAQQRVAAACRANGVAPSTFHQDDWQALYEMGVRVSGARDADFAAKIRQHAGRTMPV